MLALVGCQSPPNPPTPPIEPPAPEVEAQVQEPPSTSSLNPVTRALASTQRFTAFLARIPVAELTLRPTTPLDPREEHAWEVRVTPTPVAALLIKTSWSARVSIGVDGLPRRSIFEEFSDRFERRTLLVFDDETGAVVVKETQDGRSRVRLLTVGAAWEPLSLLISLGRRPPVAGARYDLIVGSRERCLVVESLREDGLEGHIDDAALSIRYDDAGRPRELSVDTKIGAITLLRTD